MPGARILDVRRLAAMDMALHGARFIVIEFAVGVLGCAVLGVLALVAGLRAQGISWQLAFGVILAGAAVNYVPLLIHAVDLARKRSAREEAAAELADPALLRSIGLRQVLLLVPCAVAVLAIVQARSSRTEGALVS